MVHTSTILAGISLVLSTYTIFNLRKARIIFSLEKIVDIKYGYSVYTVETGFHTQFSFSNRGNIPATDVKIRITYPAGTQIHKITPTLKFTESEDTLVKTVELEFQRLNVNTPLTIIVASSHELTTLPKILCNENKEAEVDG